MNKLLRVIVWSLPVAILAVVFVPVSLQALREGARREAAMQNMKALSQALLEYESSSKPVTLGDSALTAGIPGQGELTTAQIKAWLADAKNHAPLRPKLPFGLAAGASDIKIPADNPLTRAKIELGRQLFFDTRLSIDTTVSCASCHDPDHAYGSDTPTGVGIEGLRGDRNSPVAYNRILSDRQFWDGRAPTLEAQAIGPIENPIEMGHTHEACVKQLKQVVGYRQQFDAIFPDGLTIENVGRAIACFERTLVTGPSPWDHQEQLAKFEKAYAEDLEDPEYLEEEEPELLEEYKQLLARAAQNPMSESAIRGAAIFFSENSGCTQCHVGANFADEKYYNLGVGYDAPETAKEIDLGRYAETKQEEDRGAFKTPTLRNVAQSAPYMHDGSQQTLAEVVAWYNKGGHSNPHLSEKIKPLKLTKQEEADLVAFMEALTGTLPKVERGRLPQ